LALVHSEPDAIGDLVLLKVLGGDPTDLYAPDVAGSTLQDKATQRWREVKPHNAFGTFNESFRARARTNKRNATQVDFCDGLLVLIQLGVAPY